ncbi:MAG: hypothetical protein JWO11_4496 [Nocardioides sp.]|nr:hypothetical protein [Nocardioides sp.]
MAGRGPTPKDPAKRRRRNADPVPTTYVVADGQVRGPDLPEDYPWHAQTRAWWETWRSSPQAKTFTDTDWRFLTDTALLHNALWSGDAKVGAELRLRVAKFGATPEDRARLRLQVSGGGDVPPAEAEQPGQPGGRYGHLRAVSE